MDPNRASRWRATGKNWSLWAFQHEDLRVFWSAFQGDKRTISFMSWEIKRREKRGLQMFYPDGLIAWKLPLNLQRWNERHEFMYWRWCHPNNFMQNFKQVWFLEKDSLLSCTLLHPPFKQLIPANHDCPKLPSLPLRFKQSKLLEEFLLRLRVRTYWKHPHVIHDA